MTDPHHRFIRHAGLVSYATLISRILGYVRDACVAYAFGGGALTDAFYAAFRLPNLFRRILGEGSFTAAFVPIFSSRLARGEKEEARRSFQVIFSILGALLVGLVVLGIVFAPQFVSLIAWGFREDPAKFDLTVRLTRLVFPFMLFVCLAAMAQGALNALGYFFVPAVAPAMLSVAEIGFVLGVMRYMGTSLEGLAISAVVGGFLHFAVMVPLLRREKMSMAWRWEPRHPDVSGMGRALLPAVWGLSVDQINAYIDTICASFLIHGSVTALYNSSRLMQFPLSLFGIAMSTALLPSLSASAASGKWEEVKGALNMSLRTVLFFVVPSMVGLVVLGLPITELLFEHGRFTHAEALLTYQALAAYAVGLPAFAGSKILVSSFYAFQDMKTPVKVASACIAINVTGNIALMRIWGVGGLAIATSASSFANAAILAWLLRRRLGPLGGRRLFRTLAQSSVAALGMAGASWGLMKILAGQKLYISLPSAIVVGVLAYIGIARLLKMEEESRLWSMIRTS